MIDHLDDLESDFSRFHRVDDIYAMDGPRFFRLANRIFAYEGVMAVRVRDLHEQEDPEPGHQPRQAPAPTSAPAVQEGGVRVVPLVALLAMHPGQGERKQVG